MLTLFARPGSGSAACEAVLTLAGADFRLVDVPRRGDGARPPEFEQINPLGEVPVLVLPDGRVMTESAAILIHLADSHPGAWLSPAAGDPERPEFLRWMVFLSANVYMSDLRCFYPERYTADPDGADAVRSAAEARKIEEWRVFSNAVRGPFLFGERSSAVDLYAAMLIAWSAERPGFLAGFPALSRLYDAVAALPGIAPVWRRNDMPA